MSKFLVLIMSEPLSWDSAHETLEEAKAQTAELKSEGRLGDSFAVIPVAHWEDET